MLEKVLHKAVSGTPCRNSCWESSACCVTSWRWFPLYGPCQLRGHGLRWFNINGYCLWRYSFPPFIVVVTLPCHFLLLTFGYLLGNWGINSYSNRQIMGVEWLCVGSSLYHVVFVGGSLFCLILSLIGKFHMHLVGFESMTSPFILFLQGEDVPFDL